MKKLSRKTWIAIIAAALALTLAVGATVAYLQDESADVVNAFKKSTIEVGITESDNEYQIIPGGYDDKDPAVTYNTPDVDAYLFVKITDETDELVTYEIADGWTLFGTEGNAKVYWREVAKGTKADGTVANPAIPVLKDNKVTYSPDITLGDMGNLDVDALLTFKAYIMQKISDTDTHVAAWNRMVELPTGRANIVPMTAAEITNVGPLQDSFTGGESLTLDVGSVFSAVDTPADVAGQPYEDYVCDFVLSFDKDLIDTAFVHLFGNYGGYGWLGDDLKAVGFDSLSAGETIRVVESMMTAAGYPGSSVTYAEVVGLVQEFMCGVVVENDAAYTEGLTATLQLVMYDDAGHAHVIDTNEYVIVPASANP